MNYSKNKKTIIYLFTGKIKKPPGNIGGFENLCP